MSWQDIIISICVIAFSYALIPQIYYNFKNKKSSITVQTSLITAIGMYLIAIAYFTINLLFSATMCIITGTFWLTLLFQRFLYKSN